MRLTSSCPTAWQIVCPGYYHREVVASRGGQNRRNGTRTDAGALGGLRLPGLAVWQTLKVASRPPDTYAHARNGR